MNTKITAIVPAYNEEKRITHVLSTLASISLVTEVICVNDGSTDSTRAIVQTFQHVRLIDLPMNKGKANAIVEGVRAAKGDIVMLLDADLTGITENTLRLLADPLLSGRYDVAVGYPSHIEDVVLFRPLTGERCYFRRDLELHLEELRDKGYGLELALNYLFRNRRIKIIAMEGVLQLHKVGKYPLRVAMKRELYTWRQLIREVSKRDQPVRFAYGAYLKNFYVKSKLKAVARTRHPGSIALSG